MELRVPPINFAVIAGQVASPLKEGSHNKVPYCEFVVANNRLIKNRDQEKEEVTTFMPVIAWGKLAMDCRKYLTVESPVYVVGILETPYSASRGKCGKPRLRANEVQFLEKGIIKKKEVSVGGRRHDADRKGN